MTNRYIKLVLRTTLEQTKILEKWMKVYLVIFQLILTTTEAMHLTFQTLMKKMNAKFINKIKSCKEINRRIRVLEKKCHLKTNNCGERIHQFLELVTKEPMF